jgi:hypothetical protein
LIVAKENAPLARHNFTFLPMALTTQFMSTDLADLQIELAIDEVARTIGKSKPSKLEGKGLKLI